MIEVNNLTAVPVNKNFLKKVAKIVLKKENKKGAELSIALVGKNEIKELNKKYRKKNKATDVLSFAIGAPEEPLGEIVICPAEVKKNAKKFGTTFKKELALTLIHGILHLFGYNHEKNIIKARRMEKKQKYYLSKILNS